MKLGNSVPWHVNDNSYIIVDMNALKSRNDIFVDGWRWTLSKTYVVSSESECGPFAKRNTQSEYRVVKRIYKLASENQGGIEKNIITRHPPNAIAIQSVQETYFRTQTTTQALCINFRKTKIKTFHPRKRHESILV